MTATSATVAEGIDVEDCRSGRANRRQEAGRPIARSFLHHDAREIHRIRAKDHAGHHSGDRIVCSPPCEVVCPFVLTQRGQQVSRIIRTLPFGGSCRTWTDTLRKQKAHDTDPITPSRYASPSVSRVTLSTRARTRLHDPAEWQCPDDAT